MTPRLNRKGRFQWWCSLFPFSTGNALFGQIWPQNSKLFKVKFGLQTNSNMHNFVAVFTFSVFKPKYPFRANLFQKITVVSLSWNLVRKANSNMQNSMGIFTLFIFNHKYPFRANLVQKNQNCFSWNFVPRLFEYVERNGDVRFFCFRAEIPFLSKFGPKN